MESYLVDISGMTTTDSLNLLPLGAYDVLIKMDWLEAHKTKIDCDNKALECLVETSEKTILLGIKRTIMVKRCNKKGYALYIIHVT